MKALIIDDDPWSRTLYARLLRRLDCEPVAVDGGAEALACLERERPDFVLLDLNMPGVDGREVLRAIRASSPLAALPVVVATATTDRQRVVELIELGIAGYLVKQAGVEEALRRLELVVSRIRQQAEAAAQVDAAEPGAADEAAGDDATPAAPAEGESVEGESADGDSTAAEAAGVDPEARGIGPAPAGLTGPAPRVLVADPDASYRAAARLALEGAFEVTEATTGAAAVRIAGSATPDLVLVGETIDLPSAEALARRLRMLGAIPRVVLVTDVGMAGQPDGFDAAAVRSFVPARIRELALSLAPTAR